MAEDTWNGNAALGGGRGQAERPARTTEEPISSLNQAGVQLSAGSVHGSLVQSLVHTTQQKGGVGPAQAARVSEA